MTAAEDAALARQVTQRAEDEFAAWLQQCPSCDAGLPMVCTHPDGDPRAVIERLARRTDRAEERLQRVEAALDSLRIEWMREVNRRDGAGLHAEAHDLNGRIAALRRILHADTPEEGQ